MSTWICDSCGQSVNEEDGWIEWKTYADPDKKAHGLRLVHHRRINESCTYNEDVIYHDEKAILADSSLSNFLGNDGLMMLLSKLSDDQLPKNEVIEMIKRLHIKGYEQARLHFPNAIYEGIFEPNTPPGFYWQSDIEATIEYANENE